MSSPPVWQPPEAVAAVFREFRTCEFSTLAKDGTPITWPTLPFYDPTSGRFTITTSIGLPQKAFNVRRDGRVSLLFSDATGSGLREPPTVLVQGDAVAPDEILPSIRGVEAGLRQTFERQPYSKVLSTFVLRPLMDWYYMRLLIVVTPRRVLWWPAGEQTASPQRWEAADVD